MRKEAIVSQLPVPLAEKVDGGIILGSAMKIAREDGTINGVGFYLGNDENLGVNVSFALSMEDNENADKAWKRFTEELDRNTSKVTALVEDSEALLIGSYKEHDMSADEDRWLGINIHIGWKAKVA